MSNQTLLPTDRADQLATEFAADVAAGRRDETAARWAIVSLAYEAGIIDAVVRRFHAPGQFAKDVADELGRVLVSKAVGNLNLVDGAAFSCEAFETVTLDLSRLGSVSAMGWARQMLTAAHPNALRTLQRRLQNEISADPTVNPLQDSGAIVDAVSDAYVRATVTPFDRTFEDDMHADYVDMITDDLTEDISGARGVQRLHLTAKALLDAYELPAVIRPEAWMDREWVRIELGAHPDVAHESARAFHDIVSGLGAAATIDDRLLALWDDYNFDQIERIVTADSRVAETIAAAAVAALPRPNHKAIASAVSTVRLAQRGEPWMEMSRLLVEAWVAVECEPVSLFDTRRSKQQGHEEAIARTNAALSWPDLLDAARAWDRAPLGATPEAIARWIRSAVNAYTAPMRNAA